MRWIVPLLALIPLAIALEFLHASPLLILIVSAVALIPLAALLGRATEALAAHAGAWVGALLNSTLGNAAELIIAFAGIRAGLPELVKASISGSILGNLLLILGASLLVGGLRHGRQRFNPHIAGVSATMMTLAVIVLVVPGLFILGPQPIQGASVEFLSLTVSAVLIVIYGLYLLYSIRHQQEVPHAAPAEEAGVHWRPRTALAVLIGSTIGVVIMSELLVAAVEPVIAATGISEFFLGVMLIPLVGNVAEHFVAVQVAADNKMDLSLGIAYGSSLQIALLVAPLLVFGSLALGQPMTLVFNMYELIALVGAALISSLIAADGESNWLEGAQLLVVYIALGLGFFFLP
ncbi:calcium/proton exchanger [Thermomicrobiaceae bacterium CFH 74404]|uniref:Ca(2+)/H(+) antiporter n=2 Tax=Thermomicrobia TaxID=189775 RepID=A0AA41WD84_9BACT|nr:calcium/proton exchanger [Thermalbibacter longus]MCM8748943.1 calcium/proton exchanger [Thermalbibacter longus]